MSVEITEIDVQTIEKLIKEKRYEELKQFYNQKGYTTVPHGLVGNPAETKKTIKMLKFLLQLQEAMETGKYVYSDEKGLKKEIKTCFLGYIEISRKENKI